MAAGPVLPSLHELKELIDHFPSAAVGLGNCGGYDDWIAVQFFLLCSQNGAARPTFYPCQRVDLQPVQMGAEG